MPVISLLKNTFVASSFEIEKLLRRFTTLYDVSWCTSLSRADTLLQQLQRTLNIRRLVADCATNIDTTDGNYPYL